MDTKRMQEYFLSRGMECEVLGIEPIGSGVHGTGYRVTTDKGAYVLKKIGARGFGHDYPSDRASVHLLALDDFGELPRQVRAIDVIAHMPGGGLKSIGGGDEYYLLMHEARGREYFADLDEMADKSELDHQDVIRIRSMAGYLAGIHSIKKDSRTLYYRKLRDTIGHGECLMGVLDSYPEEPPAVLSHAEMAGIEKLCVDWRARLKSKVRRLSEVHGDFHPGNILFTGEGTFTLLDRSRGPWGEPADDIAALTINYVLYGVRTFGGLAGPYLEALKLFYSEYIRLSGDNEICEVMAPFYAFRAVVVAHPNFYPNLTMAERKQLIGFAINVLEAARFEPERAAGYLT